MKARRHTVLVLVTLLLLSGFVVANTLRYRYSPSPEHESAFLRNYSPRPVIELFAKQDPINLGGGIGSGSGWKFVTNQRTINTIFAMEADRRASLMNALSEDMAALLTRNGAKILSRSGNTASGFHFSCKDGTSTGSVTLLPLSYTDRTSSNPPLAEGLKAVRADIVFSEKWFPQESGALQASMELR